MDHLTADQHLRTTKEQDSGLTTLQTDLGLIWQEKFRERQEMDTVPTPAS